MNDKKLDNSIEENDDQNSQVINQSIGQVLKTARKNQNIEIEHVCSQLNLSSHVVEALESDNYEGLPEIAYVRGYIVSYCRLLGLDSFHVLKQLVTDDPSLSVANSIGSSVSMNNANHGSSLIRKLVPMIAIGVIAAGAFWFFTQNANTLSPSNKNSSASVTAEQNANDSESQVKAVVNDESTSEPVSEASTEEGTLKTSTDNLVDKEKKSLLELEFNSVSWVDIQNSKKEKIVYQSFPRGEKHQVKAELPLNIFIDNAAGVFIRYQGRLIDLKPYIQDGYAKFTLSE